MRIVVVRRMYDPLARKSWLQPFVINANSREEFEAEVRNLNARHPRWTGETPND